MTWIILILFLLALTVLTLVLMGRQQRVSRRDSDGDAGTFLPVTSAGYALDSSSDAVPEAGDDRRGTAGDETCTPDSNDSGSSNSGSDDSGSCDSGGGDSGSSGGSE